MSNKLNNLKENGTLSYTNCESETIKSAQWDSVTIYSCRIISCLILDAMAKNSDIIGTNIDNAEIQNTDLSHSDICSCIFTKVLFKNVSFDISTIRDCEFESCTFVNCSFEHTAMTNTKYKDGRFIGISIKQSSSYLNTFLNCIFDNSTFCGNFFYSLFLECKNTEKLLSENLFTYNLIDMSDSKIQYNDDMVENLRSSFLFLNMEIYRLNSGAISSESFLIESLVAINKLISKDILLRSEQIEFVEKVAFHYINVKKINVITIIQAIAIIDEIFKNSDYTNATFLKSKELLNRIKNNLYIEYIKISNSTQIYTLDFEKPLPCIYKITYEQEPEIEISTIINTILHRMGKDNVSTERIKTMRGSFIEFISFFEQAKPLIDLITTLLTGAAVPIVVEKIKNKTKKNKEQMSQVNININNITILNNYEVENYRVNQAWTNAAVCSLIDLGITQDNNYRGYSRDNMRSIEQLDANTNKS